jgi:hypothetical protein
MALLLGLLRIARNWSTGEVAGSTAVMRVTDLRAHSGRILIVFGTPIAFALVLAVLGYRSRLRKRDRWSRPALLAHQNRALRRLREYAYQKSRFYEDLHAGLTSARCQHYPC